MIMSEAKFEGRCDTVKAGKSLLLNVAGSTLEHADGYPVSDTPAGLQTELVVETGAYARKKIDAC